MKEVKMESHINCDMCVNSQKIAKYDGRTRMGTWAYMCDPCFCNYGVGLGLGKGQKIKYTKGENNE
jgi:hypothetical protein